MVWLTWVSKLLILVGVEILLSGEEPKVKLDDDYPPKV
jgi:hypothetical protein